MFVLGEKGVVAKGGGPTASKKVFRVCGFDMVVDEVASQNI